MDPLIVIAGVSFAILLGIFGYSIFALRRLNSADSRRRRDRSEK